MNSALKWAVNESTMITFTLLRSYNIRYIWITPEMRSGLVWNKDDEGLLFLLKNSETFKKVYSTYGYEIWEVLPAYKPTK